MLLKTHFVFALLISIVLVNFFSFGNSILFVGLVLLSSIIPDIDLLRSKIGRRAKPVSFLLNLIFGHRGFIHSIFPAIILFILLSLISFNVGFAVFIGYISHLVIDAFSKKGVMFFYPISKFRIKGRISVGGMLEYVVFLILSFIDVILILKRLF